MNKQPIVLSVSIGSVVRKPRRTEGGDASASFETAFWKAPVMGAITVSETGFAGDDVADRRNHGGVDKALLAYASAHYAVWSGMFPTVAWTHGGMGENLTIEGLDETTVCIGDMWSSDSGVLFEVSQPRMPCWKMAQRWDIENLPALTEERRASGWYLRVLRGGAIAAGATLSLAERPQPEWSVARVMGIRPTAPAHRADAAALLALPQLSEAWKARLARKLAEAGG